MPNYLNIAARVFGKPLAIDSGYAKIFFSALAPRLQITEMQTPDGEVLVGEKMRAKASSFQSDRERNRPYQFHRGVAVLPVEGSLVHKHGYLQPYSGMTGYDGIVARAAAAINDPEVKGILLDIDSHGGEVSGCFDAVDAIRQMGQQKPIWSLCYDTANSGAFAIASAAERRLITQSGMTGSVGVIMAHMSIEKELEEKGRKVTLVYSGNHKVDGNPYQDMPDEVLDRFQKEIDAMRQQFAQIISQNIGLDIDAVLATEAQIFSGTNAIEIRFADELVNGFEAVDLFADYLKSHSRQNGGFTMSQETTTPEVPETETKTKAEQVEFSTEDAANVTELCSEAGLPKLAAGLIRQKASIEDTKARIETAKQITQACKLAGADEKIDAYILSDKSVSDVRSELFEVLASKEANIDSTHNPVPTQSTDPSYGWDKAKERAAASSEKSNYGWDAAIKSMKRGIA